MTFSQFPVRKSQPLTPRQRAAVDAAVIRAKANVAATAAALKAVEPMIDRLKITHYCSVQPELRLQQIVGLWTDQMVINLCRGEVLSALEREGSRRFASGQKQSTSALAILREAASSELAKRNKGR